ncbi:MAG: peptide-methionine (S)-S-oxide reductase [Betaproteobacteria bacterium]|jgi:peptide-methionine (S)-S-oxide reductase|nr:peptide-methionine (S)-S-oxide reductase [Betaproteobacteria bacterium]
MQSNNDPSTREVATLAGGCFWCLEAVYDELKGVESVESGYMGGAVVNPTYEQVCGGDTGHAEVVQIKFDPAVVTFGDILGIFFAIHDPTTLNRQGNDLGTQYRSAIFYHTPKQKEVAQEVMGDIAREQLYPRPLVTQLEPASTFYVAEDYHQEYFARNPNQGYCQFVVAPKVAKFRKSFFDRLKKTEKTKA